MANMKSNKPAAGRSWLTPLYDFGVRVTMPERMIRDRLARLVDPKPQQRILEFGFGSGSNRVAIHDQCPAAELYRVLKSGGSLIVGDWGAANSFLMRIASGFISLIDGFETTRDNRRGEIPNLVETAGFSDVRELDVVNTSVGTFRFLRAAAVP